MKRILALLLAIAMIATFCACAQQSAETASTETARQIVQSVIDSGKEFNAICAENDDMAKGAVAALDKANISHGVGKDVIVMGFDASTITQEDVDNYGFDPAPSFA